MLPSGAPSFPISFPFLPFFSQDARRQALGRLATRKHFFFFREGGQLLLALAGFRLQQAAP